MNKYDFFYMGLMVFLLVGNTIQIQKKFGRPFLNWIEVVIYVSVMIWYFSLRVTVGITNQFLFYTTIIFLLTYTAELSQFGNAGKNGRSPFDFLMVFLSVLPIFISILFLTGML